MISISPENRTISVQGSSQRAVLLVQSIWLILVILLAIVQGMLGIRAQSLIMPVCWLIVGLTIWSFWSWHRVTGTWFDPYTMFLAAVVLFNGGLTFLAVLRLQEGDILEGLFPVETVLTAFTRRRRRISRPPMGGAGQCAKENASLFSAKAGPLAIS